MEVSHPHPFPFDGVLHFGPLIDYWRRAADRPGTSGAWARDILRRVDGIALFEGPIHDPAEVTPYRDEVELLLTAVLPPALRDELCAAVIPPFRTEPFYATPPFERLMTRPDDLPRGLNINARSLETGKTIKAYTLILQTHYGVDLDFQYPLVYTAPDAASGLDRHYEIRIDPRFCTIVPQGPLPALGEEDLRRLTESPTELRLWTRLLPPERFAFVGLTLLTAVDVTDLEVVSAIKNDLLQKNALTTPEHVAHLQGRLRALLGFTELELGILALERDDVQRITSARAVGRSLLVRDGKVPACPKASESIYARAYASECEPVIVSDLTRHRMRGGFEKRLLEQGFRNVLLAPLRVQGRLIGVLELASPRPGQLHPLNTSRLTQVLPLIATALRRSLAEREDRIQAVIKEKYTAIHPLVEWRFREAAQDYMAQEGDGRVPTVPPIVFPDVYPIYGLSDIRDSSTLRNETIQRDLVEQLRLALAVIVEASIHRPLPILDEIGFRLHGYLEALDSDMQREDELGVLEFLRQEVEPLFDRLATFHRSMPARVAAYRDALDPKLGILYRERRHFEESIALLTDRISNFLEARERDAQAMSPHYFEKYKTDGVDYNIYVGASLLEDGTFDELYLRNLRLWQLMTTCALVWELDALRPQLPTPMEVTHLLLVQSVPLTIRFRQDEKRFDVDGAYNIRYEIVKKRIDKATVRGRRERLTQPRQIAVVYSHLREAQEYHRYLRYLEAAGYVEGEVEDVELDDLQGTYGLKALRVHVRPEPPEHAVDVTTVDAARALAV